MTIGGIIAIVVLELALIAAAIRHRNQLAAHLAWSLFLAAALGVINEFGLDLMRYAVHMDDLVMQAAAIVLAGAIFLRFGLPESLEARLRLRADFPEWEFDGALVAARRPFVAVSQATAAGRADQVELSDLDDETIDDFDVELDKVLVDVPLERLNFQDVVWRSAATWRDRLKVRPPTAAWASLADRLARSDLDWAELRASNGSIDAWQSWEAEHDRVHAQWARLRASLAQRFDAGAGGLRRVVRVYTFVAGMFFLVAILHIPLALSTFAPVGRAPVVPEAPAGRTLFLVPLGGYPEEEIANLASFYAERFDLPVVALSPTPIPGWLFDQGRKQFAAEDLIELLRRTHPEALYASCVVIGIVPTDIYIRNRSDWDFAFGLRSQEHLAVISTARMQTVLGSMGDRLEAARVRKMVTKDIGILYYGLAPTTNARSVLYSRILGLNDLDGMGEDF